MATASKAFRARAFDANKSMAIFWGPELPDISECAVGNRAVTQMPSGMEKEEEMESHLQDAILAQQASTSGIQVNNHVIPTPKVINVEADRYDSVYPCRNKQARSKYIKVHAWHALEKDEPEYDYDTEDEEWLNEHPHIEGRILEKIFDTVEANSSETQIASEDSVLNIHKSLDPSIVYEVYEYWLSKRTSAATTSGCHGVGGLIPRVRTECRKDGQGSVNPYVAFRRRAEKMQTRKNRKNDEDNYEKILKLVHDMTKARTLFEMTSKREKTKLALIDMESDILLKRMELCDFGSANAFNEFHDKLRTPVVANGPSKPFAQINGVSQEEKKKKKVKRTRVGDGVVSKLWLKKTAESWDRPPQIFGNLTSKTTSETKKPIRDNFADGKYTFKRRRGSVYRAALQVHPHPTAQPTLPRPQEQVPAHMRFYETFLPSTNGTVRSVGFVRRRVGRGGRVYFDRLPRMNDEYQSLNDPWAEYCVADSSRKFEAKMHPFGDEDESETPDSTERYFSRSDKFHYDDETAEREWISSYKSSWRGSETIVDDEDLAGEKQVEQPMENCSEDGEVEKMDVDGEEEEEAQIVDSKSRDIINGNGNGSDINNEDMEVDMVIEKVRHSGGGKTVPMPSNYTNGSGNGSAGRVEPTPVPAKMCGTVSDSDEWREPSGSPSESNSSTEWGGYVPEQVTAAFKAKMMSEDDDVPSPARPTVTAITPSIKDAMSTVTILERKNKYILPSSIGT